MTADNKIRVPVLLGPTAVGKSSIALRVSQTMDLELLSCDSRQIYRYMDIGTAKPTAADRALVRHWMIDVADPDVRYSAFTFATDALAIIRRRAALGRRVMVCGGSGLYFHALSRGVGPHVAEDKTLRRRYTLLAETEGRQRVYDELAAIDPASAATSHASNLQRNIRALEVYHATGAPFSVVKTFSVPPADIEFIIVVLSLDRHELYRRIDDRVDDMMSRGLLEEFGSLLKRGYNEESPGLLCVGYRELFAYEKNVVTLRDAVEKIKRNTRNYAKRQITWLRHQVDGFDVTSDHCACEKVSDLVNGYIGP